MISQVRGTGLRQVQDERRKGVDEFKDRLRKPSSISKLFVARNSREIFANVRYSDVKRFRHLCLELAIRRAISKEEIADLGASREKRVGKRVSGWENQERRGWIGVGTATRLSLAVTSLDDR